MNIITSFKSISDGIGPQLVSQKIEIIGSYRAPPFSILLNSHYALPSLYYSIMRIFYHNYLHVLTEKRKQNEDPYKLKIWEKLLFRAIS